jgi:hypothetical protein
LAEPGDRDVLVGVLGDALASLAAAGQVRRVQVCVIQHAPTVGDGIPASLGALVAGAGRHRLLVAAELSRPDPGVLDQVGDVLGSAHVGATPLPRPAIEEVLEDLGGYEGSARSEWTLLRLGDRLVRTFGIWAWPRWPVGAGWLAPLLSPPVPGSVQVLSVHLWPISPVVALRRARSARAAARAAVAGRGELGLLASAADERDLTGTDEREAELVSGAGLYRMAGVIAVIASDIDRLDEGCRAAATAASTAGLEVRVLHGQHRDGWVAALPLCRTRMTVGG